MVEANGEQRARWNEVIGPRWVSVSEDIDAHLKEITELALAHAAPRPGEAVLEIGSGTGSMAVRLAKAVLPLGWVMGLDFSEPMVKEAENTVRRTGLGNVRFRLADAQIEKLKEGLFDLAFSRFGVMFFDDPKAAFANIKTAMKPTGRLSFICWGPLARNPHWAIPREIAVKHLGPAEAAPAGAPGPMALADPEHLRDVLTAGGWREVTIEEREPALLDEPMERAVRFATAMGPAGGLIREREPPDETVEQIRADIAAAFAPYEREGRVRVPGLIYLVGARA
ncbi:MAG: class I SAM-dependent methyltransferase [Acetobacteraceae bacterium]